MMRSRFIQCVETAWTPRSLPTRNVSARAIERPFVTALALSKLSALCDSLRV
jgi:hypothetical protein